MALSNMHRPGALVMAAILGAAVVGAPLRDARADDVSPNGKGIVGGALLGAEVPTIIEGIAGVRSGWVYLVSAIVGAGGGGAAGFAIEQSSNDGRVPMYMLAGGLALVIPAVVLTLNATRYQPDGASEDRAPVGPAAEPGSPGGSSITGTPAPVVAPPPPPPADAAPPSQPPPPPTAPPQSLLDLRMRCVGRGDCASAAFRLGVPVPDVRPSFSVAEARAYGLRDNPTELRVPVFHVAF
jgi:hypothetical protein